MKDINIKEPKYSIGAQAIFRYCDDEILLGIIVGAEYTDYCSGYYCWQYKIKVDKITHCNIYEDDLIRIVKTK